MADSIDEYRGLLRQRVNALYPDIELYPVRLSISSLSGVPLGRSKSRGTSSRKGQVVLSYNSWDRREVEAWLPPVSVYEMCHHPRAI